jgi:hypothetical protein
MTHYDKTIGRIRLRVNREGYQNPDYGHGAEIICPTGWNDMCPLQTHTVSIEELRDLKHLIERALAQGDAS